MKTCGYAIGIIVVWAAIAWADCDKTKTDYDVVYCGAKIYIQADKELNEAYQKLRGKLSAESKNRLKTGQLAWIDSRNQQCSERRGNRILVNLDCATDTTVERTQFLMDRYRECVSAGCMPSKLP
jgi:uncharacterized protein YecT (DUF1311 family)